jgi:hypothetical protein
VSIQREITLYRGQHSWPFEFVLPSNLPPSSLPTTVTYPYIKYYVRIVLEKPWYKPNTRQIYVLTIFPRVNIHRLLNSQQPTMFSESNRKKLLLQGSLLHPATMPGQMFSVHVKLQNPRRCEIKRIEVRLFQHRQIAHKHQSELIFQTDLPDIIEFKDIQLERTFDLSMPAIVLAPTYMCTAPTAGLTCTVSYQYELKFDVKVRGLFTDFQTSIPILVGNEPVAQPQVLLKSQTTVPTASAPMFDYEEPPPAYESVVSGAKQ